MSEEIVVDADGSTESVELVEIDASSEAEEPIHPLQKLMDNPWLLLVLGLLIPVLSYTVWGWIELMSVAPAQLP